MSDDNLKDEHAPEMPVVEEELELNVEELQRMLQEKTTELLALQTKHKATEIKALALYEENQLFKHSTDIATQQAEFDYQMKMAKAFIAGKAFNCATPEQAYVLIKAGGEMGLKPVESMQALYIVNGAVRYYGDKMIGKLTQLGFKINYTEESKEGVTVTVSHPNSPTVYQERVTVHDDVFKKSKAFQFAPKNKMRFHGVRMIASFYLPHLFMSVSDEFTSDFHDWDQKQLKDQEENTMIIVKDKTLRDQVLECKALEELETLWNDNKVQFSRDINLTSAVKQMKEKLASNDTD